MSSPARELSSLVTSGLSWAFSPADFVQSCGTRHGELQTDGLKPTLRAILTVRLCVRTIILTRDPFEIRFGLLSSNLTLSGLIQFKPQNVSLPKTVEMLCFLYRAVVFIHLKSLFAARFKLCVN